MNGVDEQFPSFPYAETPPVILLSAITKIWRTLAKISEFRIIYLAEIYIPRRIQMIVPLIYNRLPPNHRVISRIFEAIIQPKTTAG